MPTPSTPSVAGSADTERVLAGVGRRLADAGDVVLVPDLFYRSGPNGPFVPKELFKALSDAGVRYVAETYVGAQHGWMKPDFPVYDHGAAESGWVKLLDLFKRILRCQEHKRRPRVIAMDLLTIFASALLIGVSIAAPVGPIGLLTIQRRLEHGPRAGLATGLGAAAADAVYGAIGAYGVTWLIGALVAARVPLTIFGAAFLLGMSWGLVRAKVPAATAAASPARSGLHYFATAFTLTLSNPAIILSFVAVFGTLAGRSAVDAPGTTVLGVLLGSSLGTTLRRLGPNNEGPFRGRHECRPASRHRIRHRRDRMPQTHSGRRGLRRIRQG